MCDLGGMIPIVGAPVFFLHGPRRRRPLVSGRDAGHGRLFDPLAFLVLAGRGRLIVPIPVCASGVNWSAGRVLPLSVQDVGRWSCWGGAEGGGIADGGGGVCTEEHGLRRSSGQVHRAHVRAGERCGRSLPCEAEVPAEAPPEVQGRRLAGRSWDWQCDLGAADGPEGPAHASADTWVLDWAGNGEPHSWTLVTASSSWGEDPALEARG